MITELGGIQLSRSMILALHRAEREQVQEAKAAEARAVARQEQMMAEAQAYYAAYSETRGDTLHRQSLLLERQEEKDRVRRSQERAEAFQAHVAGLLMSGRGLRSHEDVLNIFRACP